MGTSVGTAVFTKYGWRPAAALSVGFTGFTILVMFIRGPHVKRYTWVGWEGGWEMRKSRAQLKQVDESAVVSSEDADKKDPSDGGECCKWSWRVEI